LSSEAVLLESLSNLEYLDDTADLGGSVFTFDIYLDIEDEYDELLGLEYLSTKADVHGVEVLLYREYLEVTLSSILESV